MKAAASASAWGSIIERLNVVADRRKSLVWLQWILATMIAVPVGFAAIVAVRGLGVSDFPDSLTGYAASGAILGGAVGIAQWLVLRRQIPNAWPLAGYWVLGSALWRRTQRTSGC